MIGAHPGVHGTYLAICVFFAAIWQESPVGIESVSNPSITEEEKLFLQQVTWDTVMLTGTIEE